MPENRLNGLVSNPQPVKVRRKPPAKRMPTTPLRKARIALVIVSLPAVIFLRLVALSTDVQCRNDETSSSLRIVRTFNRRGTVPITA